MYKHFIKRLFDIVLSSVVIIIILPFMLIIALIIPIDSKGPIFFLQTRVGKNGCIFQLYKLRTMTNVKRDPSKKQTYSGDPDITRFGGFLRRFKIDELPQILNVFLGDMSLVGPRPALASLYSKYGDIAQYRLSVAPGMTGLSQVNGNIFLSWEERFQMDKKYIDHLSFSLDASIILKTLLIIICGEQKYIKK